MTWTLVAQIGVLAAIACVATFVIGGVIYAVRKGGRS